MPLEKKIVALLVATFLSCGFLLRGGGVGPSPPSPALLTPNGFTLVNTSGSSVAAGGLTPVFGVAFKQGDIPSGTAPIFKIAGVAQPYCWGGATGGTGGLTNTTASYWPDGSVRFTPVVLRLTGSALSGSGSLTLQIYNGGSPPTHSARTLTEVYNQNIIISGTGLVNLSGTWKAWLDEPAAGTTGHVSAGTDSNNHGTVQWIDGDACAGWIADTDFAQTQGGTAHGALSARQYELSLTDASGNLGGIRYLPRVYQPWYNNDGVIAKAPRAFSALSWQFGAGPTVTNFLQPFATKNFTASAGSSTLTTTTANNWITNFANATSGGYNQQLGVVLSSTGTLPTGLSANKIYVAARPTISNTTQFQITDFSFMNPSDLITPSSAGTGTHTITPVLMVNTFGSLFGATANATWNYFQGTGSTASDATIRMQYDAAYAVQTGLIPKFNLSVSPAPSDNTIVDDWNPYSVGPTDTQMEDPGERDDLGIVTSWAARDVYYQSALDEKLLRIIGFAGAHQSNAFKDITTRQFPNLLNAAYTGFPSSSATTLLWGPWFQSAGFTAPASQDAMFAFGQNASSHRPEFQAYAYFKYGEPQFLDLIQENAQAEALNFNPGANDRNPSTPVQRYYSVTRSLGVDPARGYAWAWRDLINAAIYSPGKANGTIHDIWGADTAKYFGDAQAGNAADWADLMTTHATSAFGNSYVGSVGYFMPLSGDTTLSRENSSWQRFYFNEAAVLAARGLKDANAITYLGTQVTFYNHVLNTFGGLYLVNPEEHNVWSCVSPGSNCDQGGTYISSDSQFMVAGGAVVVTWTNTNPYFKACTNFQGFSSALTMTNGDKIGFGHDPGEGVFPTTSPANQIVLQTAAYFARDVTSIGGNCYTFNLAATLGGTVIVVTNTQSSSQGTYWFFQNVPNSTTAGNMGYNVVYQKLGLAVMDGLSTVGAGNVSALITDMANRLVANSQNDYTADPKFARSP